jgi:hypothetical protein
MRTDRNVRFTESLEPKSDGLARDPHPRQVRNPGAEQHTRRLDMKKISMVFACALVFVAGVFATPRYVMVTGAGTDTETDQPTAHQNADSQAQTNLQNACPGSLSATRKIFDMCNQIDGNYVCSINYTATCQIGN